MGTSTRKVAVRLWQNQLPDRDPALLVRELYFAENQGKSEPSGSQDMIGIIYPGISRLDYDASYEAGIFPVKIESTNDPAVAAWLEHVLYLLPVNQRPLGYNPLGLKYLDESWIQRLGDTGDACFQAILGKDTNRLGASFNECMRCWEILLPHTVTHPSLHADLIPLLNFYQSRYAGAMYSGCGGGYLIVASENMVPGALRIKVRTEKPGIPQ